ALPEVEDVVPLKFGAATIDSPTGAPTEIEFHGLEPGGRAPWKVLAGTDLRRAASDAVPPLVVNRRLAERFHLAPGSELTLRCASGRERTPVPPTRFRVTAVVELPFDEPRALTSATRMAAFRKACGQEERDDADLLLVASREGRGAEAAVRAIRAARPDVH